MYIQYCLYGHARRLDRDYDHLCLAPQPSISFHLRVLDVNRMEDNASIGPRVQIQFQDLLRFDDRSDDHRLIPQGDTSMLAFHRGRVMDTRYEYCNIVVQSL